MTQARRTSIPAEYLRLLGVKLKGALELEHAKRNSKRRFTIERVCVYTGIPFSTMMSYLDGKRMPPISDLRDILEFAGVTFEEVMSVIPSRKHLDDLWDRKIGYTVEPDVIVEEE